MSGFEFFSVFLFFFFLISSSTAFGYKIITFIHKLVSKPTERLPVGFEILGVSSMIGLAIFGYTGLLLGLINHFSKDFLLAFFLLAGSISIKPFVLYLKRFISKRDRAFLKLKDRPGLILLIFITIIIIGTLYLAAMQPPHTSDELHYHFPQAREIVLNKKISLDFGGHPFYGSIPKLMEIIFSIGIAIAGYPLAHALNFYIFVAFLAVVFGVLNKIYNFRVASWSIFLISIFDDFTWNASGGFIDAATASMEIGSLMFILLWISHRKRIFLPIAGALVGIGLAIKYSPIPTLIFETGVLIISFYPKYKSAFKKYLNSLLLFFVPLLFFGGFWYLKNLLFFRNPFYPLYFGHSGISNEEYLGIINSIQQFGAKNVKYLIELTKVYLNISGVAVFASIYLAPFVLFVNQFKKSNRLLFTYFFLYLIYWFFLATHQTRFLIPALLVSSIILGIILSRIKTLYLFFLIFLLITLSSFLGSRFSLSYYLQTWNSFWNTKLHLVERQYALGNISESEFLRRNFGCQYGVIEYLQNNNLEGNVIDNWSVWHAPSVAFYAESNTFSQFILDENINVLGLAKRLENDNFKYIYFNTEIKTKHLENEDPLVVKSKNQKLPTEMFLLENSNLIYEKDNCRLYEIDLNKLVLGDPYSSR